MILMRRYLSTFTWLNIKIQVRDLLYYLHFTKNFSFFTVIIKTLLYLLTLYFEKIVLKFIKFGST